MGINPLNIPPPPPPASTGIVCAPGTSWNGGKCWPIGQDPKSPINGTTLVQYKNGGYNYVNADPSYCLADGAECATTGGSARCCSGACMGTADGVGGSCMGGSPVSAPDPVQQPVSVVIPAPVMTNGGISKDYEPWAVWVAGNNLNGNTRVRLMENNNRWGADGALVLGSDGAGSFSLPSDLLPSGCNTNGQSCNISVVLVDSSNGSTGAGYTLSVPSVPTPVVAQPVAPVASNGGTTPPPPPTTNSGSNPAPDVAQPVLTSGGVSTGYEPWAIWFAGQNLTSGMQVQLYDNGKFWATVPSLLSGDATWGSFNVPSDAMPSGCNRNGQSCPMSVVLTGSNGSSNSFPITMPSAQ